MTLLYGYLRIFLRQTGITPKKKRAHGESLARSVEKLAVADEPKVKSKNLNVVEEFEKSGLKRMANFVVVGMYFAAWISLVFS